MVNGKKSISYSLNISIIMQNKKDFMPILIDIRVFQENTQDSFQDNSCFKDLPQEINSHLLKMANQILNNKILMKEDLQNSSKDLLQTW
jgi:hypothetical protein